MNRWTRSFAVGSALSMVAFEGALLVGAADRVVTTVGLFGAVLPMVFGMAYLLLPSYVGRTLSAQWLPGVHFGLTYVAVGLLVGHELAAVDAPLARLGTLLWSGGVLIFVGTLLRTILPAVASGSARRPFEAGATRLAPMALPVAVGYLVVGTGVALSATGWVPEPIAPTRAAVVHLYATGFVTLLVFALGIRLLTGFFRVSLPGTLARAVLVCGGVAPGVLSTRFWRPPWFLIGAGLEAVAMAGYAALVAVVAYRTDRRRAGLYGICLGALGGVVAVGVAGAGAFGVGGVAYTIHPPVALGGFLLPTIVGYAYLFFPVTNGQFRAATPRTAAASILFFGGGTAIQAIGAGVGADWLHTGGTALALIGTGVYAYLIGRRLS